MKIKKKQSFFYIYKQQLKDLFDLIYLSFIAIILLIPFILGIILNNRFYFLYLIYFFILLIYFGYIFFYRFYKLSHLPLTKDEKEMLKIYSAEDCIVFLNLYLRYGKNRFTLFDHEEYLSQVEEFIVSSKNIKEKTVSKSIYEGDHLYNIQNLDLNISQNKWIFDSYFGSRNPNWKISEFCKEYFDIALDQKWTWQQYAEKRDAYGKENK